MVNNELFGEERDYVCGKEEMWIVICTNRKYDEVIIKVKCFCENMWKSITNC